MSRYEALQILTGSLFIVNYILVAVCITKIIRKKYWETKQVIFSWIPFLQLIPIAKIANIGFWGLVLWLLGAGVFVSVIERFILFEVHNIIGFWLLGSILYAIPAVVLWAPVAEAGGFENPPLLGFLVGLPIIGVFVAPYIAWKGDW